MDRRAEGVQTWIGLFSSCALPVTSSRSKQACRLYMQAAAVAQQRKQVQLAKVTHLCQLGWQVHVGNEVAVALPCTAATVGCSRGVLRQLHASTTVC